MEGHKIDWSEYHRLLKDVGSEWYRSLSERERKAFLIGARDALVHTDWFRNLKEADKKSVLIAFSHDTRINANRIRAALTFIYLVAIYAIAFAAWGLALKMRVLWFAIGGVTVGAVIGGVSANMIANQRTVAGGKDMQFASGTLGVVAAIAGAIGLLGWLVRSLVFG